MKNKFTILAIFSFLLSAILLPFFKYEFSVLADGAGETLGVIGNGAFTTGIELSEIEQPQTYYQTSSWVYTPATDYISFRDSTTVAGFKMQVYMSSTELGDFVYDGPSLSQSAIDVSNFKIFPNYASLTYLAPTKGVDDSSKTLNIFTSGSCAQAEDLKDYRFNSEFFSVSESYGMRMSSTALDYFRSDVSCEVSGEIKLSRMELYYPPGSNEGSYEADLIIVVIDGSI